MFKVLVNLFFGISLIIYGSSAWAETRNYIINPEGAIGQRGLTFTSATSPDNSDWKNFLDRWAIIAEGTDSADYSRETSVIPVGSTASIKAEAETANNQFGIYQAVENRDTKILGGDSVVLSFQARTSGSEISHLKAAILCWTGSNNSISNPISTWGQNNGAMVWTTNHSLQAISNQLPLADSFQRYELLASVSSTCNNLEILIWVDDSVIAVDDELYISQVQLTKGNSQNSFSPRAFATEIVLAQRFFAKTYELDTAPGTNSTLGSLATGLNLLNQASHVIRFSWTFPQPMVRNPSKTFYTASGTVDKWDETGATISPSVIADGKTGVQIEAAVTNTTDARIGGHIVVDGEIQGN